MKKLTVSCDCQDFERGEGREYSLRDFLDRKHLACHVSVNCHKNGERLFARAENESGVYQVAIEKGEDSAWLCEHGIAALSLLGKTTRVIWDRERAEKVAESLERGGNKVRCFEVNGRVSVVCW